MAQAGRSARHTFGSDPDAVGRVVDTRDQHAPPAQPDELPPRPIWWLAARERASELEGERGRVISRLLSHVEAAWALTVELSALAADPPPMPESSLGTERLVGLLAFLRIEVVEVFASMALQSATTVPALGDDTPQISAPEEIESVGERFYRNALILHLAAADTVIPPEVRDLLRRVSRDLLDWYSDYPALAIAAARLTSAAA
jgi:hypothetical protein